MIADCPLCLTRAMLTIGKPCPACGGMVTREILEAFDGLAAVTVDEGTAVPGFCFLCDAPRTRTLKIRVDPESGNFKVEDAQSRSEEITFATKSILAFVLGVLRMVTFGFHTALTLYDPQKDPGIRVYVPCCDKCSGRVHVGRVNGADRSVTILAGAVFSRRIAEAGKAPGGA
jgi:hypothetical protein